MPQPTLAMTLDVEADHGWRRPYRFEALERTGPLQALLDRLAVPLTVFATGESLERDCPLWDWFDARGDPVGLHSHSHPRPGRTWDSSELSRSTEAFRARFARDPSTYRPPYGRLHPDEPVALAAAGIAQISTFRKPAERDEPVQDRPVSRVLGVPASLSVLQILGRPLELALPAQAVVCMHLHDVIPTTARAELPPALRAAYAPAARHGDPLTWLEAFLLRQARRARLVHLWPPPHGISPQL